MGKRISKWVENEKEKQFSTIVNYLLGGKEFFVGDDISPYVVSWYVFVGNAVYHSRILEGFSSIYTYNLSSRAITYHLRRSIHSKALKIEDREYIDQFERRRFV